MSESANLNGVVGIHARWKHRMLGMISFCR